MKTVCCVPTIKRGARGKKRFILLRKVKEKRGRGQRWHSGLISSVIRRWNSLQYSHDRSPPESGEFLERLRDRLRPLGLGHGRVEGDHLLLRHLGAEVGQAGQGGLKPPADLEKNLSSNICFQKLKLVRQHFDKPKHREKVNRAVFKVTFDKSQIHNLLLTCGLSRSMSSKMTSATSGRQYRGRVLTVEMHRDVNSFPPKSSFSFITKERRSCNVERKRYK